MISLRHIALFVPKLRAAEEYYQPLFAMELIGREATHDDVLWYTLPFDKSWDDAEEAGITLGMVALRKEEFILALFQGEQLPGQVFAIGLNMSEDEIARVRAGLPADAVVLDDYPNSLTFRDRYQIMWHLSAPGNQFRTAGEFANRWLQL